MDQLYYQNITLEIYEFQSTLRKPAVNNMRKALYLQYSVGLFFYYGVSIVGYWAYGSTVSVYLPEELSGPKWANVTINAITFVQSIISQHVSLLPRFHLLLCIWARWITGQNGSFSSTTQVGLVDAKTLFFFFLCQFLNFFHT